MDEENNFWGDIFGGLWGDSETIESASSSFGWTGIIGSISDLGGSAFDYFGSKDDVELSEIQLAALKEQAASQEEIARQKTKMYIIIGGILFFILTISAIVIISKNKN